MITYLDQTMSLNNLRCAKRSGQVATILLFLMVVLLVFIMATMNIGHLAVTTTNLANAADAASLYLTSQLGTRSRLMFESLATGTTEYCKPRGLLAFIFSWVGAIIGQIICGPPCAVAGGTIGGGVGGAIDGSGFEQGLTTGFKIGLALGGAMALGGGIGGVLDGCGFTAGASSALSSGAVMSGAQTASMGIMGGIDLASSIYNFYNNDKDLKKGMREIAKAMNGLDLKVQFRESTYLSVLSQVVNDPNLVKDGLDIDLDGDTGELVSAFQQRWFDRTLWLAGKAGYLKSEILEFNSGHEDKEIREEWSLGDFRNFAEKQVAIIDNAKGALARCEFTSPLGYTCSTPNNYDGSLVSLARILEDKNKFNKDVSFWESGKPEPYCKPNELEDWCLDREIHDPIDRVTAEFLSLIAIADEMKGMIENGELNRLAEQWTDWIGVFYYLPGDLDDIIGKDSESDGEAEKKGGYYFGLEYLVGCGVDPGVGACASGFFSMEQWKDGVGLKGTLRGVQSELKQELKECDPCISGCCGGKVDATGKCLTQTCSGAVCNPKCKLKLSNGTEYDYYYDKTGHISDKDFNKAIADIDEIIQKISKFKKGIFTLYDNLKRITTACSERDIPLGEPVVYPWTDSAGEHSVAVNVHFPMPYIKYTSNWEEVCVKLRNGKGTVTVDITRTDPKDVQIGILGKWNPVSKIFSGNVTRLSRSKYSYDLVPIISATK